jgi:hypothetical protein
MIPVVLRRRASGHPTNTGAPAAAVAVPALAVVDVDLFNYCLCVRYLVAVRSPGALTSGPVKHDNISGVAVEDDRVHHRDCVTAYRVSSDGACVAGSVTLPTPLQADTERVVVAVAPLSHDPVWHDVRLAVKIRISEGRVAVFTTRWTS